MLKRLFISFSVLLSLAPATLCAQIRYKGNGVTFTIPEGFVTGKGGFATFYRDSMQVTFENRYDKLKPATQAAHDDRIALELFANVTLIQIKDAYRATVDSQLAETRIKKFAAMRADLSQKGKHDDYYLVLFFIHGKRSNIEILLQGLRKNRERDLGIFDDIMNSFNETK